MYWMYFLTYISYLFLIIFLIIFDRKKPMLRFGWILLLVLLPVVGLILYIFLGSDGLLKFRQSNLRLRRGEMLAEIKGIVGRPPLDLSSRSAGQRPVKGWK